MKGFLSGLPVLAIAAGLGTVGCQQQGSVIGVLASGEMGVTSIAVDDFYVYWTTQSGQIRKVPVGGGLVQSVTTGQPGAGNLVVDATHLVWSTGDSISALAKTTGTVDTFVANGTVQRLSTDATSVYWTVSSGDVNAASKSGSQLRALATAQTNPVAISAGSALIYWANAVGAGGNDAAGGAVLNVGVTGGVAEAVLPTQDNPVALMTDASYIYWGNQGDSTNGTVSIAALDGTNPQTLANNVAQLHAVIGDGVSVYYSSLDGSVSAVPMSGAAWMTTNGNATDPGTTTVQSTTPIVIGPPGTVSLTMDATNLYWTSSGDVDGAILTMPKL